MGATVHGTPSTMDCTSCESVPPRQDKPHTFFAHEKSSCPDCNAPIEARVVLRGGGVVQLLLCMTCGPRERHVSDDAAAWVKSFLARGVVPEGLVGDHLFKHTTVSTSNQELIFFITPRIIQT